MMAEYKLDPQPSESIPVSRQRNLESLQRNAGELFLKALADPRTIELMLNPDGVLWQERLGEEMQPIGRMEAYRAEALFRVVASCLHKTITWDKPQLDGEFPLDGSRFSGALPPVVSNPIFAIRKKLALNGVQTSPNQRNGISAALVSMAATGGRSLSDFVASIQDTSIREALLAYTVDGSMGTLLDAEEDGLAFAHESNSESASVTTFEIEDLMNLDERWVLPILLYLFRRIERALKGQPACIVLDEAWLVLDHPVFREKIREWFKVLRKANCALILATQNLSDAANSGIFDAILESTATKIYLPNVYARNPETAAVLRCLVLIELLQ